MGRAGEASLHERPFAEGAGAGAREWWEGSADAALYTERRGESARARSPRLMRPGLLPAPPLRKGELLDAARPGESGRGERPGERNGRGGWALEGERSERRGEVSRKLTPDNSDGDEVAPMSARAAALSEKEAIGP